jgi:hypothetical protein
VYAPVAFPSLLVTFCSGNPSQCRVFPSQIAMGSYIACTALLFVFVVAMIVSIVAKRAAAVEGKKNFMVPADG